MDARQKCIGHTNIVLWDTLALIQYLSVSVLNHMMTVCLIWNDLLIVWVQVQEQNLHSSIMNETKIPKMPIIPFGNWHVSQYKWRVWHGPFNTMIICYAESIRLLQVKLVMIYNNLHKRQQPHATAWNKPITLKNMSMKIEFPQIIDLCSCQLC